jgi:hypothetical protein
MLVFNNYFYKKVKVVLLETVSLSEATSFTKAEGVLCNSKKKCARISSTQVI